MATVSCVAAPANGPVVRIVAERGKSERVLAEYELTLSGLGILQPNSPLSREFLNGAGLSRVPRSIAVYVNGVLAWRRKCHEWGQTALMSSSRRDKRIHPVRMADFDTEQIAAVVVDAADRKLAGEYFAERDFSDDIAEELLQECPRRRQPMKPRPSAPSLLGTAPFQA